MLRWAALSQTLDLLLCTQQQRAEQEEEFITNRLTKRLTQLKREKQNLANEVGGGYMTSSC